MIEEEKPIRLRGIMLGKPPLEFSEIEIAGLTPLIALDFLYVLDKKSLNAKIRQWYRLYDKVDKGELFLRDVIKTAELKHPKEKYNAKLSNHIIKLCNRRIRKEQYWIYKNDNIKWLIATITSFFTGTGLGIISSPFWRHLYHALFH